MHSGVPGALHAVDVTGEALAATEYDELRVLAEAVASGAEAEALHDRLTAAAARVTNARCAALYVAGDDGALVLAGASPGAPPELTDVAGSLRELSVGRGAVTWSPGDDTADVPLAGVDGWSSGLAAGFTDADGVAGLLAVGEPAAGGYAHGALERLSVAAALAAPALGKTHLRAQQQDLEGLLAGAVKTSARLVGADEPGQLHRRLLEGLVSHMGLAGAALWEPAGEAGAALWEPAGEAGAALWEPAGEAGAPSKAGAPSEAVGASGAGTLTLAASAGLPDEVRARVATLPATSDSARLAAGRRPSPAGRPSDTSWPGHPVHLVALPHPAAGVLGIYSARSLPPLIDGVLAVLAQAVAAAERQAALHQRARTLIDSLQRELRPSGADLPPSAEAGWVYQSAMGGADVGGDFYDVFAATSGHVGVACGDVSGKGIEAASLTAMAVHTLRAFALQGTTPQVVLTMLNGTVCKQIADERFITLAYARIDPVTWSVGFALAGHPPPLVVGPAGVRAVNVEADIPLGVDTTAAFREHALTLMPGEALVLVTDGVTEARGSRRGELLGVDRLAAALEGARGARAQAIADRAWQAVQEWTGSETTDDCAVVVVRHVP